jgi:hypothetical protein
MICYSRSLSFSWFSSVSPTNARIVPYTRTFPSKSFPIHYSLVILSFDASQSKSERGSLYELQTNSSGTLPTGYKTCSILRYSTFYTGLLGRRFICNVHRWRCNRIGHYIRFLSVGISLRLSMLHVDQTQRIAVTYPIILTIEIFDCVICRL